MRNIITQLGEWRAHGKSFAVATIVASRGSSPQPVGSSLAVDEDGAIAGSISAGCVEATVYELARDVLRDGRARTATFGSDLLLDQDDVLVPEEDALLPALTCGGEIDVVVRAVNDETFPQFDRLVAAVAAGRPVATVTPVSVGEVAMSHLVVSADGSVEVGPGGSPLDEVAAARAAAMLATGTSATIELNACTQDVGAPATRVFVESLTPPARMVIFGAADFAGAVASIGTFLGYRTTVCDARPLFATQERFPDADEVVVQWPHRFLAATTVDERTVVCVMTHDPKFDVPTILAALRTPARYIGVMGSRRTHADRIRRLREAGVSERDLARLSSPVGLDLGARTPQETAVAIAAEIIALGAHGSGARLSTSSGPIHR